MTLQAVAKPPGWQGETTGVARGGSCHPKKIACHPTCHPGCQKCLL